jgi:hypothetical protein
MWVTGILLFLLVLALGIVAAILYGNSHWQSDTAALHRNLQAERIRNRVSSYDQREIENLPAPVQRYFRAVLKDGQSMIASVNIEHGGVFNIRETTEQWKPFTSSQRVISQRPGFVWDARINMLPMAPVFVHDAYIGGEGVLTAKLFGFLTVMNQPSSPELAQGELMRFFAESAWYPTALLPSQGVHWEAINDRQASATLTDGDTTVGLVFEFDTQGLISAVRSDGRYRDVNGVQLATPWQGRFWKYEPRDGILIPMEGEVAWVLTEGLMPYWRGRIQRIQYEYVQ